ncbi:sialate O-acetylesterase [Myxococcota bacterium]|nr:sialate O-acetylesterase [Myxococcota bacterium]
MKPESLRRWPVIVVLAILPRLAAAAPVELTVDVPEAADHVLVQRLDVPAVAAFNATGVPYAVDRSDDPALGPFARVAWHLQLEDAAGTRTWVYVSARAFTDDPGAFGVPAAGTGLRWQRDLDDVTVRSNVPGVTTGDGGTGGLEFWPTNYYPANGAGVPGARDDVYDAGDTPAVDGGYGSLQVHGDGGGRGRRILFAINRWGTGDAPLDIGIGDCVEAGPNGLQPDWTFLGNAGRYTTRRLDVYLVPGDAPPELGLTLDAPTPRAVYQRRPANVGPVPVRGRLRAPGATRLEARVVPFDGPPGAAPAFTPVAFEPGAQAFDAVFTAPAGWHRLEVQALDGAGRVVGAGAVEPVGVGEVFVTAGQSNAANHGERPLAPTDDRVSARGYEGWRRATDPQPIATGTGGTPWPALGDLLATRFDVPVGLISVAWGGTSVAQWQPGAADALYLRLAWALGVAGPGGVRAVLWHQGESDAAAGTTAAAYAARLDALIRASRADAGWAVPWIVARVGFLPNLAPGAIAAVVEGQQRVIDTDPLTAEGPATDDLQGPAWRYDQVHFTEAGLREHARRWAERIVLPACSGFADPQAADPDEGEGGGLCPDAGVEPPEPPEPPEPTDGGAVSADRGPTPSADDALSSGPADDGPVSAAPDAAPPAVPSGPGPGFTNADAAVFAEPPDAAGTGQRTARPVSCAAAGTPRSERLPLAGLVALALACVLGVRRRLSPGAAAPGGTARAPRCPASARSASGWRRRRRARR